MVECHLAKVNVEGSNPFTRLKSLQKAEIPDLGFLRSRLSCRPLPRIRTPCGYDRAAMKSTGSCPKCGSSQILANVTVLDQRARGDSSNELTLAVFEDPNAILFKGGEWSKVSAWVCAECGFAEFYADRPGLLSRIKREKA